MQAYTGKVLWVDLTHGTFTEENLPDTFYQKYLSGLGLAAALLYREIPPKADPLGPDNILAFASGLLTGTGSLFTGRWMAAAKSPLTGTWGDANCGGTLAPAIKQCGYDAIFFKGISDHPVYLFIGSHGPELRDATHLWGKDAIETEDALKLECAGRKKPEVACIGPAGERLSLIAGIVNDRGRLAARSGLGAVMGSKHLKAMVLAGSRPIYPHNWLKMRQLSERSRRKILMPFSFPPARIFLVLGTLIRKLPFGFTQSGLLLDGILAKWGTVGLTPSGVEMGDTPFKNWAGSRDDFPTIHGVTNPEMVLAREQNKYHCYSCPLGCGGIVRTPTTNNNGIDVGKVAEESHKPEYETICSFTTMLLNEDMPLVYQINDLLNRAGMDSISAGGAVAFAMECYEKGWLTLEETGGLELTWGNAHAIWTLVNQMITREGLGAWLADGVKKAAEHIQHGSAVAAIHAGGQEIGYHDPRLDPGMGLHASVEPTPGRHTTGSQLYYEMYQLWTRIPSLPTPTVFYRKPGKYEVSPDRTREAVAVSEFTQFYNGAGACMFGMLIGVDRVPIFEWMNAATGWTFTPQEYLQIGKRIQTVRQMFNIREGIDPHTLKINPRLSGQPPMQQGPNAGAKYDLDTMMSAYWLEIGWDSQSGIPTPQTIIDLALSDLVGIEGGI